MPLSNSIFCDADRLPYFGILTVNWSPLWPNCEATQKHHFDIVRLNRRRIKYATAFEAMFGSNVKLEKGSMYR